MTTFNNQLTPAEEERLSLLCEEMGEVLQIIGKIGRHGYASRHPLYPTDGTNRDLLMREIGDVLVAIDLMIANGDISEDLLEERKKEKSISVRKYLHHEHMWR